MSDMTNLTTRICSDCGKEYPLNKECFRLQKDKSGKYYYQRRCIFCVRAKEISKYRDTDGAKKMRDWRKTNPVLAKEAKRRTEKRNPETVKARKQRSHIRCKEKNNARTTKWFLNNREYIREKARNDYLNNRDIIIARVVQYQRDNPEQFRAVQHRRRAREMGAKGVFVAADILNLYNEQDGRCAYCGITLHDEFEIDHVHPISRGGTNWPDNLALACDSCNASKKDKTPEEWAAVRGW